MISDKNISGLTLKSLKNMDLSREKLISKKAKNKKY